MAKLGSHTAHVDTFARDNLPPEAEWPDLLLDDPRFRYPARLNVADAFLHDHVARGHGAAPCLEGAGETWSYADLADRVDRLARVLVERFGLKPGNRVLLRAPNNPWFVACHFAVWKAGGIVVATMPLLRAGELAKIITKARINLALCDHRLLEELEKARGLAPDLATIVPVGGGSPQDAVALAVSAAPGFPTCPTAIDDVCLIAFTSGTTGEPKGTMHFHRDLLVICDAYGRDVLRIRPDDKVVGSPPLAFTFGLGGLVLFPMRVGGSALLLEKAPPPDLLAAIRDHHPTVCFTAPTAWRAMIPALRPRDTASLRACVSAGEVLPKATFEAWKQATGLTLLDGIGATEMLHIFIGAPEEKVRPGATGLPVPGYEAKVIDEAGAEVAAGVPGRLAVRGPTGCRYLADPRQRIYVQNGWNVTGDTYIRDADGYFWYQARSDDMIVSAGYNIAGPEVEAALLTHPAVRECGVVGAPDPDRGTIVMAYVVLAPGHAADQAMVEALQAHVRAEIAPYKYPRAVAFVDALPRTETGKVQRFALRRRAAEETRP